MIGKETLSKIFPPKKKVDGLPSEKDNNTPSGERQEAGVSTIEKFLSQVDSYMNPPRLAQLQEEWGNNFDALILDINKFEGAISQENAEMSENAKEAKKKLLELTDKYLDETLAKSKTKNKQNPYAQVDALQQRVQMIENILSKISEYKPDKPDKPDKLSEIRKNIGEIEKSYQK